jgi:hypothetical protein
LDEFAGCITAAGNRDLVVKTARPELLGSEQQKRSFRTRSRGLGGLGLHPHIVLLRPARASSYVEEHPTFVTAAVVLGAAGLALAVATAAVSPSIDHEAPRPRGERPA